VLIETALGMANVEAIAQASKRLEAMSFGVADYAASTRARTVGIGAFVLQAGNLMQTDQLLAGVVILSLFGLAVGKAINVLETRLLHWR
jgi:ABC-type nitrate/sulfonate/bicarbonate transport system permease component